MVVSVLATHVTDKGTCLHVYSSYVGNQALLTIVVSP